MIAISNSDAGRIIRAVDSLSEPGTIRYMNAVRILKQISKTLCKKECTQRKR